MNTDKTPDKNTVREQLLDHAQVLLMTRGYNGFSYRDLSALVGVKTSSIHYYFPSKEDLIKGVVGNAMSRFRSTLSSDGTAIQRLREKIQDHEGNATRFVVQPVAEQNSR